MSEWNNVDSVACKNWLVLPTVYSDALSYGEQLDKFCYNLNKVIENNNILPDYISDKIKEYISSGEIEEVVRDVIGGFILNVKYPPKGITPAIGDGSTDDGDAFQGCIDYVSEHGGAVYVPYGSYLVHSIQLKSNVAIFGFDRYSTKVVLKGGAEKALLYGENVTGVTLTGMTLDSNSGIQVNDVDVVNVSGGDYLFYNLIMKDGYQLLTVNGNTGNMTCHDIVNENAVNRCWDIAGSFACNVHDIDFEALSKFGKDVIRITCDRGIYSFASRATCDLCLNVTGNNNYITARIQNAKSGLSDGGKNNSIEVIGQSKKEYYSWNLEKTAHDSNTILNGANKLNVVGNNTLTVGGNNTLTVGGNKTLTVSGNNTLTVDGNKSETVTGITSETFKKDRTVNDANVIYNGNKRTFNDTDLILNPTNPLTYKTPTIINSSFSFIPFKDNDDEYKVLVGGDFLGKTFVLPQDFGAKGDGVTDDTEAFRNAIEYCINNGTALFVPSVSPLENERGYILSKPLNIDFPITIVCDPLSTLYWKNAHLNTDTTIITGRNNSKKYESGYGINIDYGTYGGHKGYYKFGIIQGDKSFIKENATLPTGKYWVGINIQSADLVHLEVEYINYWLIGTRLHSNDTGGVENCRVNLGVTDDCDTGMVIYSSANGCYTNQITFNTIGQGANGIAFNPTSDIVNNTIIGEQILVEAPNGLNIGVYGTTNQWNFKNNKISVKSCFNGVTPNTKNRHGYSGQAFHGTILSGDHDFTFGYGAYGMGVEYELGFWDTSTTSGNMVYYGGEGCTMKNTLWNVINTRYTPVLNDSPVELSAFNNGAMIPANTFIVEYTTEEIITANTVLSLWFFATCLPISSVSNITVTPLFLGGAHYVENWNTSKIGLMRILWSATYDVASGTKLSFLVKVGV